MKRITLIMLVFLAAQTTSLIAQTDTDVVNFNAILAEVFDITVTSGNNQTANFDTPTTYNVGIDAVGTSTITVEATNDWDVQISAPDFTDGGTNIIPINNLGVWCESTGNNAIGTEVTCAYTTLATCMGLTIADQMLLDHGTGTNAGDALDNAFNLNWTMGTLNGSMNTATMLQQVADGTIGAMGTYTTVATLTLTAE